MRPPRMGRAPWIRSIVFDLDGTLVDSADDILDSVVAAYRDAGFAEHSPGVIDRSIIGPPLAEMVRRLTPAFSEEEVVRVVAAFRVRYDQSAYPKTLPYEGVRETLRELAGRGVRLLVVTNKPSRPARRILERSDLDRVISEVMTPDTASASSGTKAAMLGCLAQRSGLQQESTLVVGDMPQDIEAAHENGLLAAAVLYGYGRPDDLRRAGPEMTLPRISDLPARVFAVAPPEPLRGAMPLEGRNVP